MKNIFEGVDLKDVALIIGGLITAISTITAMIVTNFYNLKIAKTNITNQNKQKNYESKIQRIEDFYYLYEKWEMNYQLICINHLQCHLGHYDYSHIAKLEEGKNKLLPGELQKIQMLLNIHLPELKIHQEKVELVRASIAPYLDDPKKSKLDADDFFNLQDKFDKVSRGFKEEIANLAHIIKEKNNGAS